MPVNYDQLAPHYHARYAANPLAGLAALLRSLAPPGALARALEVGCGTGRWLAELRPRVGQMVGLDLSVEMLRQARAGAGAGARLVNGSAEALPLPAGSVDLVACINALHHFDRPAGFVIEARRVLRPGGVMIIVGMNPHVRPERWYLYDYFSGTRQADLARFPSAGQQLDWLAAAGFGRATWQPAETIRRRLVGRAVLADPFLQKGGTSQLSLLSDVAYAAGRSRLAADLAAAEARGEEMRFEVDLTLYAVIGWA